jgi:hypothetical protein
MLRRKQLLAYGRKQLLAFISILARVRFAHWIGVLAIGLTAVDLFIKPLTPISLGLIAVALLAVSPFWATLPQFLKTAELPGGIKLEFREQLSSATETAEQAGLLVKPKPEIYELIYNDDPTLALAGLRIAIEKRLNDLLTLANLPLQTPLSWKIRDLSTANVLSREQASALSDLLPLLNRAVHSHEYTNEAADWAMTVGPKLLAGLDERASQLKGGSGG